MTHERGRDRRYRAKRRDSEIATDIQDRWRRRLLSGTHRRTSPTHPRSGLTVLGPARIIDVMKNVASLPPIVATSLLTELEAAGIPAGSTDLMAPGVAGAIPGLSGSTVTVWVEDEAHLAAARGVLKQLQADAGDDTEYFKDDEATDA